MKSANNKKLTKRDIYCAAKFLQSIFFSNEFTEDGETNVFYGCNFCKFGEECRTNIKNGRGELFYLQRMRKAISAATGVNLGPLITENMFEDKNTPTK